MVIQDHDPQHPTTQLALNSQTMPAPRSPSSSGSTTSPPSSGNASASKLVNPAWVFAQVKTNVHLYDIVPIHSNSSSTNPPFSPTPGSASASAPIPLSAWMSVKYENSKLTVQNFKDFRCSDMEDVKSFLLTKIKPQNTKNSQKKKSNKSRAEGYMLGVMAPGFDSDGTPNSANLQFQGINTKEIVEELIFHVLVKVSENSWKHIRSGHTFQRNSKTMKKREREKENTVTYNCTGDRAVKIRHGEVGNQIVKQT